MHDDAVVLIISTQGHIQQRFSVCTVLLRHSTFSWTFVEPAGLLLYLRELANFPHSELAEII